jgi:hypothetical protein
VVALLDMRGRIKGSNLPVHQPVGAVHDAADGLIGETHYFLTWRKALEAAGLRE